MADLTYDDVVKIVADEAWGACEACRADPRAILRALSAAGIALVPREATFAQRLVGDAHMLCDCRNVGSKAIYADMLAAGEIRETNNG